MSDNIVRLKSLSCYRECSGLAARLRTELAALSNVYADDLAGYVVICVNDQGEWSLTWKTAPGSPMGQLTLAGLAQAAIQLNMVADRAALEAIIRNGLCAPPPDDPA